MFWFFPVIKEFNVKCYYTTKHPGYEKLKRYIRKFNNETLKKQICSLNTFILKIVNKIEEIVTQVKRLLNILKKILTMNASWVLLRFCIQIVLKDYLVSRYNNKTAWRN